MRAIHHFSKIARGESASGYQLACGIVCLALGGLGGDTLVSFLPTYHGGQYWMEPLFVCFSSFSLFYRCIYPLPHPFSFFLIYSFI